MAYCSQGAVLANSSAKKMLDCNAYREIVAMGPAALPYIREAYDIDASENFPLQCIQGHGLVDAVAEIVGEKFAVPKPIRGRVRTIEEYTKRWLDDYLNN